jgi:hypothetical protein
MLLGHTRRTPFTKLLLLLLLQDSALLHLVLEACIRHPEHTAHMGCATQDPCQGHFHLISQRAHTAAAAAAAAPL